MTEQRIASALDMEDRRFAAMEANDTVALEQVLADDLHYTHANGMVEDKAEVVRRIASGERVYQKVRMIEREVSPQNGFIAVYGKVLMEVSRAAGLLVTQLEYTAIYRDHDPRLFAWQATKSYAP
ncbi:nuclear transport factor 2 family protein [Sphingopyxis granuli]|uniref:nuclear transport factor 2 family protein n=1 Tax=Sphingopyxis granuli TaxID=267128 RepID=UPI001FD542C4|nr:nuclear transport factor 2 family protein [Sphingopyxis granuli]